jgi:hypothetical protein
MAIIRWGFGLRYGWCSDPTALTIKILDAQRLSSVAANHIRRKFSYSDPTVSNLQIVPVHQLTRWRDVLVNAAK